MTEITSTILHFLKEIEAEQQIRIVFAAEGGSRSWGWANEKTSDRDVRFIYVHSLKWYLSIDEGRKDVLDFKREDIKVEFHGWDIKKALKMLRESNTGLLEWIYAPIIYTKEDTFYAKVKELAHQFHSKSCIVHHYLNTFNKHDRLYFENRDKVILKKYFYVLRPLLSIQYVQQHNKIPPVTIQQLISELDISNKEGLNKLHALLKKKVEEGDLGEGNRIQVLDKWIDTLKEQGAIYSKELPFGITTPMSHFNELFYSTVMKVHSQSVET